MTKKGKILILALVLVVCFLLVMGATCLGATLVGAYIFLPDILSQSGEGDAELLEVLPEGRNFEKIEIDERYPAAIVEGYRAHGGFVFRTCVYGYSSNLVILVGIDDDGKVVSTKVLSHEETPTYAETVFSIAEGPGGVYVRKDINSIRPYGIASGATMTSHAYCEAVKAALEAANMCKILNGGEEQ